MTLRYTVPSSARPSLWLLAAMVAGCQPAKDAPPQVPGANVPAKTVADRLSLRATRDSELRVADCMLPTPPTIAEGRVGPIRIGMGVDDVRATCRILRDSLEFSPGGLERQLLIAIGIDTARLWVSRDTVNEIRISSPRFQTAGGLRVGAPLVNVANQSEAYSYWSEGLLWADSPVFCAISFGAYAPDLFTRLTQEGDTVSLAAVPRSVRISEIDVSACHK